MSLTSKLASVCDDRDAEVGALRAQLTDAERRCVDMRDAGGSTAERTGRNAENQKQIIMNYTLIRRITVQYSI